jgi:hypothetical protein
LPEAYKTPKPKLSELIWDARLTIPFISPTSGAWSAAGGGAYQREHYAYGKTGTSNNCWARVCASAKWGFIGLKDYTASEPATYIDWTKKLRLNFMYVRSGVHTSIIARIKLFQYPSDICIAGNPPIQIDDKGIALYIDGGLKVYGCAYGSAGLATIDLNTTLTENSLHKFEIIHYPNEKVEFYIDDVLKGTITDTDRIPSGSSSLPCYFEATIEKGVTGINGLFEIIMPLIIQEL